MKNVPVFLDKEKAHDQCPVSIYYYVGHLMLVVYENDHPARAAESVNV